MGSSKCNIEEDGYSGFRVNAEIIKSRTNISGAKTCMVYDQDKGFSKERSLLEYARDLGLVNGSRIASRYLGDDDSVKFNEKDIVNEFKRPEVQAAFDKWVYPELVKLLSRVGMNEKIEENNQGIDNDALLKIMTDVE